MSWSKVMFAVPSPHDIGPIEIDKVGRIAAALDAQLELFHCAFDADLTRPGRFARATVEADIRQLVSNRQRELERAADRFRARSVRIRTSVRWDYPVYEGIVRQVLRHRPRLLIARSSRRGRAERLILSHTDWKLIETCPCPLLLLKTRRAYAEPLVLAAVDPGHAHDKPAALDEEILDSAGLLSDALSGELQVFHARTPWDEAIRTDPKLRDLPEYRDEEIHRAYLKRVETTVLELAERHNIARPQVHVEDGPAAEALPRYAGQSRADIVAMGAVSRSRLRRAVIGHTAERVLDALNSDLLIVKPPRFRSTVCPQSTHHVATSAGSRPHLVW
jgi:universal stress protein E